MFRGIVAHKLQKHMLNIYYESMTTNWTLEWKFLTSWPLSEHRYEILNKIDLYTSNSLNFCDKKLICGSFKFLHPKNWLLQKLPDFFCEVPQGNSLSGFFTVPSTKGIKFLFSENTSTMYADTTKAQFQAFHPYGRKATKACFSAYCISHTGFSFRRLIYQSYMSNQAKC